MVINKTNKMFHIAIDLTPFSSGKENREIKFLILELLTQFIRSGPHQFEFILLTADWNHQELAAFEGPRFKRLCVLYKEALLTESNNSISNSNRIEPEINGLRQSMQRHAVSLLSSLVRRIKRQRLQSVKASSQKMFSKRLLHDLEVNLLFCPFTALTYAETGIPVVSIFHDLKHQGNPQFFNPHELEDSDGTLTQIRQRVDSIICISEYSRQNVLAHLKIPADRTYAVPICFHSRLSDIDPNFSKLETLKLKNRPYFFYPSNFWPHKNHRMLLIVYNILLRRKPDLDFDLVFTGDLLQPEKELQAAVEARGLKGRVHFLG